MSLVAATDASAMFMVLPRTVRRIAAMAVFNVPPWDNLATTIKMTNTVQLSKPPVLCLMSCLKTCCAADVDGLTDDAGPSGLFNIQLTEHRNMN